ncbi:MAG: hypothetical protein ACYDC3_09955 [Candidatus Binataceae bacterium]
MRKSNFALRPQPSLFEQLRGSAAAEAVTLNQFIDVAVAEKLAALRTEAYFRDRAVKTDIPGALKILDRLGVGKSPRRDDKLAEPKAPNKPAGARVRKTAQH